ncbi:folate/biopterin family MFS transporter [Caminibacter mediatlanticus TB-2]|uniref:Folate/biopterin family MFS transporter n=1 Tax=Caminibacter mediatlanticus TB-2 TaxID=391592 RepID=A0ABX5V906_9BACT|nr:folate/biopterin family MFS transporter [Caminibacter mediatlanticus]QCT94696.1 folate/biopterin family MFS transporter [Caminibacter mediatlanticus TB-2]
MIDFKNAIKNSLLNPIKHFKLRYLPLLMIYFAYGASGISGVAETFWVKEELKLSATALVSLGVWLSLPWSVKMVFGQLVDSVPILGSQRRAYVYIGAGLITIGTILLIGLAGNYDFVKFTSKENVYIISSLLSIIGFVLQDVVADAMSTEVVDRNQSEEKVQEELAYVQILGRLAISLAGVIVAGLSGWLAQIFSYETMFKISLLIPLISIIGVTIIKIDVAKPSPINCKILCGGLIFAVFIVLMGYGSYQEWQNKILKFIFKYSQEIIVVISLIVISYMISLILKDIDKKTRSFIIKTAIVIFVYRAMPSVGPGLQWWEIDVLGFDKAFFGTLSQIGAILSILGMWLFSDFIAKKPAHYTLLWLTIITTILFLPIIALYYNIPQSLGISPKTVALIDTAISSPFAQLSMIPLLTLIAIYAPEGKRATWFALMASLMNLALTTGGIFTKYLNEVFPVSRKIVENGNIITPMDYSNLGILMIIVTILNVTIPLVTIYYLMIRNKN